MTHRWTDRGLGQRVAIGAGLVAAGALLLCARWFRHKKFAGKPLIMTGGSLHLYSKREPLETPRPTLGGWQYDRDNDMKKVRIKWKHGDVGFDSPARVVVTFDDPPDSVRVNATGVLISTAVRERPVADIETIEDPEDGVKAPHFRHKWKLEGRIASVRVLYAVSPAGDEREWHIDWPGSNEFPRIKVR